MKVAIVGSRDAKHFDAEQMLVHIPRNCTQIISGGASGIDSLAREVAEMIDVCFVEFPPDYKKYGKSAPLKRNIDIILACDLVLAFWDLHSRGTAHTLSLCIEHSVPFRIIPLD